MLKARNEETFARIGQEVYNDTVRKSPQMHNKGAIECRGIGIVQQVFRRAHFVCTVMLQMVSAACRVRDKQCVGTPLAQKNVCSAYGLHWLFNADKCCHALVLWR